MSKKNIMFLIMLISIIVLAVGMSTYAFLQPGWRRFNEIILGSATGSTATFTAYSDKDINIDIDPKSMSNSNASNDAIASASTNITIQLEGSQEEMTTCTYDLIWIRDSKDQYKEADVQLPYTHDDINYPYELSIKVGNDLEKDLSSLTWLVDRAPIMSKSITVFGKETKKDIIPIEIKIYNLPIEQKNIANKYFNGHVEIANSVCQVEPDLFATVTTNDTLSQVIKKLYNNKDGTNDLYLQDKKGNHEYTAYELDDNSYRYVGGDPKNFLCFGSEEEVCPEENLYRIIGVFGNQVKLYKYRSIGDMAWNTSYDNTWENSSLETYLNGTFLSSLGAYSNYISDTIWSVGGINDNSLPTNEVYKEEMNNSSTITRKVGLVYAQEYGISATPSSWNEDLMAYHFSTSWMYDGFSSWTISKWKGNLVSVNFITSYRIINSNDGNYEVTYPRSVHPVFSLDSKVLYNGGKGTIDDPFRVNNESLSSTPLNTYIMSKYIADGTNDLYYHDGVGTYTNANLEAGDKAYRYSGGNPNNYVCFSGDDCTDDNKYRIIGVYDGLTKLVKYKSIGSKAWNENVSYDWEGSTLEKYLNQEWIKTLGDKEELIYNFTWSVSGFQGYGGISDNAKEMYKQENDFSKKYTSKIGLIYVHDFMYAGTPKYWLENTTSIKEYNWLAFNQWTISKRRDSESSWPISDLGYIAGSYGITSVEPIHPSFYLKSSVRYFFGTGTLSNPYIIG